MTAAYGSARARASGTGGRSEGAGPGKSMPLGPWILAAMVLVAGELFPGGLEAQVAQATQVPVRLVTEGGAPLVGAAVRLLGRSGETVSLRMSDREGRAVLEAPGPGEYRVQVERLGYGRWSSEGVVIGEGAPELLEFVIPLVPVTLDQLEVIAEAEDPCVPQQGLVSRFVRALAGRRIEAPTSEDRLFVFQMYTSVVAAMTAVVEDRPQAATWRYRVIEEEPILRDGSRLPRGVQVDTSAAERAAPGEGVPSPEFLARYGYLEPALPPDLPALYHPLTPEAVISEAFYATHCFSVVEEPDSAWVGLAFEPRPDRVHYDVRGVIWMDTLRMRPTSVEYHYTELARFMQVGGMWQEALRQAADQRAWAGRVGRPGAEQRRGALLTAGVAQRTEVREHLPDPAEQDFGGALRFGQAPHGGWDIVRTEIRWPGVRTGWTFDGSLITERSTPGSSHVYERFLSQWTQILHYRRVEELVDVAPGGR